MSEDRLQAFITENAAAYALGTLDEKAMAEVDAHVLFCDQCAQILGEAESAVCAFVTARPPTPRLAARVASIASAVSKRKQRPASYVRFAIAAIVALAILGSIFTARYSREQAAIVVESNAMSAMLHGHFVHAQFANIRRDAPLAKVVFAHETVWLYVIVQGTTPYEVIGEPGGRVFGTTTRLGNQTILFIPSAPGAPKLVLRRAGVAYAFAHVVR